MTLTQKDTVLRVLRDSGAEGVRSDRFIAMGIVRAAARVLELRGEGYDISSTREKQFTRYVLTPKIAPAPSEPKPRLVEPSEGALFELPKPPSAYDPYEAA